MSAAPKLTKKQKKALAFRDRGKAKGKGKAKSFDELDNDIPVEEDQDRADAALYLAEEAASLEAQAGLPEHATKGGPQAEGKSGVQDGKGQGKGKKRKREEGSGDGDGKMVKDGGKGEEGSAPTKKAKKRKGVDGAAVDAGEDEGEGNARKQKFILFVAVWAGNLKYITTKEAVAQHFSQCDPPPTVRLMTPKPSHALKPTAKSKGFAFVEFSHQGALQQGLKLHQSELEGRKINVELTAGGGGNSENRLEKVKQRNKELHDQRKKQLLKGNSKKKKKSQGVDEGEGEDEVQMDRPQRYSATSGVDQIPFKKRTWSIAEERDEALAGKKRGSKKGKKRPPKPLGTGVNAIPVG
uniref:Glucanase (EC) n=1 Tax=Ganoderma boninense TaxID=34458 RepID=A0A5K1JS22_9APHY|nr:Glucanase (EC [Ganoderma boninense]